MSDMQETIQSAKARYEAALAQHGKLGTPEGNALTVGFVEGVSFGIQVEGAALVRALNFALEGDKISRDEIVALRDAVAGNFQ